VSSVKMYAIIHIIYKYDFHLSSVRGSLFNSVVGLPSKGQYVNVEC